MKKHIFDENQFKLLRMIDDFARSKDLSINDENTIKKFLDYISTTVKRPGDNPALVHGFRIESMFAHIAAALGESKILTEEDAGVFFSLLGEIRRPDFRLVTRDGGQYFIEVKNFHKRDHLTPYKIKASYLSTLLKYSEAFEVPLKIALYWSRWRLWTLIDPKYFNRDTSNYYISLVDALKRNEMALLGDRLIGTVPPLSFRVYADPEKPRKVDTDGKVQFTIGKTAIYANGIEIDDEFEKKLAWFFMLHCKWEKVDQPVKIVDGHLDYKELSVSPIEWDKRQGFAMLGYLSEMFSSYYNFLTAPEGEILHISPSQQPDKLSVLIPQNYKGKVLKLGRFIVQPNYNDIKEREANIRFHENHS